MGSVCCFKGLFWLLVVDLCLSGVYSHLCMITPRQRGPMDISVGGSHTCFRHGAPCGGQTYSPRPYNKLMGGQPVFFKWQQNYNHYEIGYPGYMDIAFAVVQNVTSEPDPFTILATVTDFNWYDQAHQQNYTAVITLPNVDCDHCVIRARYQTHKPGETIFYQCADVTVVKSSFSVQHKGGRRDLQLLAPESPTVGPSVGTSSSSNKSHDIFLRRALAFLGDAADGDNKTFRLVGIVNTPDSANSSSVISVDAWTGERTQMSQLPFGIDIETGKCALESVMSYDLINDLTILLYNGYDNLDAMADKIVALRSSTGVREELYNIVPYNGTSPALKSPFSSMTVEVGNTHVTFNIEPNAKKNGSYYFVVGRLYTRGMWEQMYKTAQPEDLYVNFMWADYDIAARTLYVLLGNENDAQGLSARLYKFLVPPGHPLPNPIDFHSYVTLNVSQFTFSSFYINNLQSSQLYAISPGLWKDTYPAYHLVTVDVDTGNVKDLGQLTPKGIFERYYGGVVFNAFNATTNEIVHVLRVADTQADVIMHVNVLTKQARFSKITNLRNVKNLGNPWLD